MTEPHERSPFFEATDHLLRSPRNAARLLHAIAELEASYSLSATFSVGFPGIDERQPQPVEIGDIAGRQRGPG